jgi:hypothetical protein
LSTVAPPVTLAVWEAKSWRILAPGQLGKTVQETPISVEKSWVWWYAPVIPAAV